MTAKANFPHFTVLIFGLFVEKFEGHESLFKFAGCLSLYKLGHIFRKFCRKFSRLGDFCKFLLILGTIFRH